MVPATFQMRINRNRRTQLYSSTPKPSTSAAAPSMCLSTTTDSYLTLPATVPASWHHLTQATIDDIEMPPEEMETLFKDFVHTSQVLSRPLERIGAELGPKRTNSLQTNTFIAEHQTSPAKRGSVELSSQIILPVLNVEIVSLFDTHTRPSNLNVTPPASSSNSELSSSSSFVEYERVPALFCPVLACQKKFHRESHLREHLKEHASPLSVGYHSLSHEKNIRYESRPDRMLCEAANRTPSPFPSVVGHDVHATGQDECQDIEMNPGLVLQKLPNPVSHTSAVSQRHQAPLETAVSLANLGPKAPDLVSPSTHVVSPSIMATPHTIQRHTRDTKRQRPEPPPITLPPKGTDRLQRDRQPPCYQLEKQFHRPEHYEPDTHISGDSKDKDFIAEKAIDDEDHFDEPPRKLRRKKTSANKPQRAQQGIKKYPCLIPDCRKSFVRPADRKRHERFASHGEFMGEGYRCARCLKVLSRADAVRRHMLTMHAVN
ncbi:hypothetical protein VNI00_004382 [Paramarasmius palmivorus]|uniref:C2H2-type domain-containing protein n=1 Tax=Paramarasmius palmivorus TaxID=297713 RepID=A0AAW0DKD7_9AGAR